MGRGDSQSSIKSQVRSGFSETASEQKEHRLLRSSVLRRQSLWPLIEVEI